jgi:acyl-CoA dehydrogenase
MDTTRQMVLDSADRLFRDHCDKQLLDSAETGRFAAELWTLFEASGLPELATPAGGGSLADVFHVLRVAGRHAVPLPLAEVLIANYLTSAADCGPGAGRISLGIADTYDTNAGAMTVALRGVPWARAMQRVCCVIGDPVEIVLLDVAGCEITSGANIAGEARDDVRFVGVPVRRGSLPDFSAERIFELMALARAAQMSGVLERVLELSLLYAKERKQFGRPIGGFQAIQHNLAVMAGHVAAALRATDAAIAALDGERFAVQVAVAKSRVGEAAGLVAEGAHQVHGAMGFTHEHQLHHFTRRLLAWRDEYGRETEWQRQIGRRVAAAGADAMWDFVVGA